MKTHAFNNLPEPRKTFSDDLSKLFVSFLWDGKKRENKKLKIKLVKVVDVIFIYIFILLFYFLVGGGDA